MRERALFSGDCNLHWQAEETFAASVTNITVALIYLYCTCVTCKMSRKISLSCPCCKYALKNITIEVLLAKCAQYRAMFMPFNNSSLDLKAILGAAIACPAVHPEDRYYTRR